MMTWLTKVLGRPWSWFESLVITFLALTLSFHFSPQDPFFFQSAFPWIWFAPVLLALRYGLGPSLFSVGLISIFFMMFLKSHQSVDYTYQRLYLLGGFIITLICAEFSTLWSVQLRRSQQIKDYAEQRLDNLTKAYYVVQHSHNHLEQSLISKPVTLRTAVQACREALVESKGVLNEDNATRFLNLLAHYCNLESASLFLYKNDKLQSKAVASTGDATTLDENDPLVVHSLEEEQTSYYAINQLQAQEESKYLVVAPLKASDGRKVGLLVVKEMPFLALHYDNLEILIILLNYYADEVWATQKATEIIQKYPDCPAVYAAELLKWHKMSEAVGTDSAVVGLYIKAIPEVNDILLGLEEQQRGLDFVWFTQANGMQLHLTLLPNASQSMVKGYITRLQSWLTEKYQLAPGTVKFHYLPVSAQKPVALIEKMFAYAHGK